MSIETSSAVDARPADWPSEGPIDLVVHDLPHASSTMEWWYVNTHLTTVDGRELSLFAAFFRVDVTDGDAQERTYAHFLTWALTDTRNGRFFPHTLLDRTSPDIALRDIDDGRGPRDARLSRALREVFAKGRVPLPDRLMASDARVDLARLDLSFDGNRFHKRDDGSYELHLTGTGDAEGARLRFTLEKPVVRHGDDGVVRGVDGENMFYYFSPRCRVEGAVRVDGVWGDVAEGTGWYDHEFGDRNTSVAAGQERSLSESKVAWNWLAAQLDNGYEVSAYDLFDSVDPSISYGRWVIIVDPTGKSHAYTDFVFDALGRWTSTKTFNEYPTGYRVEVPATGLCLDVTVAIPGQEILTIISPPAFWEGAVTAQGAMHDVAVAGRGFVERSGVSVVSTTDDFFASVGRETRRAIDVLLPERPDATDALALIGGASHRHFLDGVDLDQYARTVLQPIREIILRGGKAWRSYGVLCCMDLVGGDSQPSAHWLALPELLHVGSLIIDDVQDQSDVRRGGPSCHKVYGDALAINAGCASYFLAQIPIGRSDLSASTKAYIYEAYFEAVRAAHAGQALDIDGLHHLMPGVVESGDGAMLERRVLATHRLKSAAPAAAIARVAARLGGGTEEQAEGVGSLFEAFGLAFQIIDDVLNLRGFEDDRKNRGEDITAGKITAPVAKAMSRLGHDDRSRLANILASRPADKATILRAASLIDGCGALDACEAEARDLVESAWTRLDPLVPDSQFKVRLRAFGSFILDRYY